MNIVKNGFFVVLLIAVTTVSSFAKRWDVTFTRSGYVPAVLQVAVGDTIVWKGSFGTHPLEATSVPSGVTRFFYSGNIDSFEYVIPKIGVYDYQCYNHPDMIGKVTVTTASVEITSQNVIALLNYPNPVGSSTSFHFNLPQAGNVSMKLYDIKGNMVADVMNGYRPSGENEVSVNTQNLANGTYICKFESGAYLITREIVVVK